LSRITQAVRRRVARTFIATFLAVSPLSNIAGTTIGAQPVETSVLRAAIVATIASLVTFLWLVVLDPSPLPSLETNGAK
jgi:hypothetical protein